MRTPWKFLYDLTNPVIQADVPVYAWDLQGSIWMGLWAGAIAIFLWVIFQIAAVIAPMADLTRFLDSHFLGTWLVLCGLYFFYSFFRMVWDGLKVSTVKAVDGDNRNG